MFASIFLQFYLTHPFWKELHMKKSHLAIVAAAALAIGGFSVAFAADDAASDANKNQGPLDKVEQGAKNGAAKVEEGAHDAAVKTGIASADSASANMTPHAAKIHKVLAQVAEAAFTKNGFTDIEERLSKADRDRLDQNKDALKNDDTVNGRVAELQKDWQAKYNQKFDIKDQDKVLNQQFASIDEMAAGDKARTASGTVAPDANAPANTPANTPAPADATADQAKAMDRATATVHIPESHGLPALDVPMVHEGMSWRIDIPDSVDSAKLRSNLQTALTDIGNMKDQWSADVDDAYRQVTHRVLLALFDKPATDAGAAPSKP
jgi:hypothetical protein